MGYWLKFDGSQSISLTGIPIDRDTVSVTAGWNMIGPGSVAVAVTDVASIPSGIKQSEFFGYNAGYHIADTLRPAQGYWIKVSTTGKLILSPPKK